MHELMIELAALITHMILLGSLCSIIMNVIKEIKLHNICKKAYSLKRSIHRTEDTIPRIVIELSKKQILRI